jgi:hypothetical protein
VLTPESLFLENLVMKAPTRRRLIGSSRPTDGTCSEPHAGDCVVHGRG